MKSAIARSTQKKKVMKLITAQELQNMNENDLVNFFNELSRNQAQKQGITTFFT